MSVTSHRQTFGRILLVLYAVLLVATSVHVHRSSSAWIEDSCLECVNHLPHNGHLTSAAQLMHDCVLCQLHAAVYIAPLALSLLLSLGFCCQKERLADTRLVQQERGIRLSRAPPFARF